MKDEQICMEDIGAVASVNARILVSEEEKQRRKELKLPVTKPLRYMKRNMQTLGFDALPVVDFEIVARYGEAQTPSLLVTVEGGEQCRVFSPFFAEMQKPSFEKDMEKMAATAGEED